MLVAPVGRAGVVVCGCVYVQVPLYSHFCFSSQAAVSSSNSSHPLSCVQMLTLLRLVLVGMAAAGWHNHCRGSGEGSDCAFAGGCYNDENWEVCATCHPGKYTKPTAFGQAPKECHLCANGYFASDPASSSCKKCPSVG